VARKLYDALITSLDAAGVRVLLAGIALPNEPSVLLHEQLGFEKVAHLKQVGRKFDKWVDVGYWERLPHGRD
jgi:phosphinothricin acetyltransferase